MQHDATIRSPGSTLAVRGTQVSLTDTAPFAPVATSLTGKARYTNSGGQTTALGNTQTATIENGDLSAAWTAAENTYVDPTLPGSRGEDEQEAIMIHPRLSTFTVSPSLVWQGPQGSPRAAPPVQQTNGSLIFQLVWIHSQSAATTPDVDLYVTTPAGEALCPKECPATVPSGGRSPTDHTGGGNLQSGEEIAAFQSRFPLGNYKYQVRHVSGDPAEFQVVVVRNGAVVGQPVSGSVSSGGRQSFDVNVPRDDDDDNRAAKAASRQAKKATRQNAPIRKDRPRPAVTQRRR